jgi:glycosyltransferase involved in cell wall biosynthesis
MIIGKLKVSVLIMTQNEESNIPSALESVVGDFDQVIVVDSYSIDKTKDICLSYKGIDFYENDFQGWAEQRNWMLKNCNIRNNIVFFLDADEWIDSDFILELNAIIQSKVVFSAIYLRVKFLFLNKWLKYSYGHPKIKRIFNKDQLYFSGEGAREYAHIDEEKSISMSSYLIHQDRRSFDHWVKKHLSNADREASLYIKLANEKHDNKRSDLSFKLRFKLFIRHRLWNIIPLGVRPFFYFLYRYFLQLGFLDGKEGFLYCVNHALWYQMLIDIKIIEGSSNE